jgi:hypothetical protein
MKAASEPHSAHLTIVADQSERGNPMTDIINVTPARPIESIPLSYRQIGSLKVCAWCDERAKSAFAITDPPARAVFNVGNCAMLRTQCTGM